MDSEKGYTDCAARAGQGALYRSFFFGNLHGMHTVMRRLLNASFS